MDSRLKVPLVASILAVVASLFLLISFSANNGKEIECTEKGMVYSNGQCRTKTVSEKYDEKCKTYSTDDWIVLGTASGHSCSELKKAGLERAYVEDNIIEHNKKLYEGGTEAEIKAGKESGDYCLTAADSWSHIGEKRCVVFSYEYMACSNGYCFLDEKKDYKTGFVAFFGKYNMFSSWDGFKNKFYNKGPILVCGIIETYQGHPQIKIYSENQFLLSPNMTMDGKTIVYKYSCK